ncbi:hypothetical protein HWV62_38014 [Athelia sp. TMB]|nr:hypothetical protein HWV62_38014 [Athelia sp. TMB]
MTTEVDELVESGSIPEMMPTWIALWIMDKCDEIDPETQKPKPLATTRAKYAHAQKMRASMSHKFGRDLGLGTAPWIPHPVTPGRFVGNPSLSPKVSQYMVRAGEQVTSARAMDEHVLKQLYTFNMAYQDDEGPISRKRKAGEDTPWGGSSLRMMLQLIYILAFLCLLRFDEVLNIQWSWVTLDTHNGRHRIKLALPYRKTHQYGGKSHFFLIHRWNCLLSE